MNGGELVLNYGTPGEETGADLDLDITFKELDEIDELRRIVVETSESTAILYTTA